MAPTDRTPPPSLEEREIADSIARLEKTNGMPGCPGHCAVASAQVLSLRIGEMMIYRLGQLSNRMAALERLLAARQGGQTRTPAFGPIEVRVTSAAAVALALVATYWKARGWL